MEYGTRRNHGQGDLAAIVERHSDRHLASKFTRVERADEGNQPRCASRVKNRHHYQNRKSHTDRETAPGWNRKKLDASNQDRPEQPLEAKRDRAAGEERANDDEGGQEQTAAYEQQESIPVPRNHGPTS